jgi:hypothetical protein
MVRLVTRNILFKNQILLCEQVLSFYYAKKYYGEYSVIRENVAEPD